MPHLNVCVSAAWRSIWRRSLRSSVSISSFLSSVVESIYPCHSMRGELHRNEWLYGLSQISHEDNSAGWLTSAILSLSFSPSLLSFPKRLLPLELVTLDVSKASSLATRERERGREGGREGFASRTRFKADVIRGSHMCREFIKTDRSETVLSGNTSGKL